MNKRYRLAIIVSNPTQFEAPLYKKISQLDWLELKVFFWATDKTRELIDPELGYPPGWDFSLTDGYSYSLLPRGIRKSWQFLRSEVFRQKNYDAVIVNGYGGREARLCLLAGFSSHTPVILRSDTTLLYYRPLLKRLIREPVLRMLFSFVPAFMATGSLAEQHLLRYGVADEKIFLLPYAVDNDTVAGRYHKFMNERDTLRTELGISSDSTVVLVVAKFVPREGVFDLLQAYARIALSHPKIALVLVGDGEQRELLLQYVREHKVPRVNFAGYQLYSLLPKYFAIADVFVHPAINEPWGVSVNEAMACGLPVIVSDLVGAAYDLVEDGGNGFIYSGANVDSLENALGRFLSCDSDKRGSMKKRSLEIIRDWGYEKCRNEIKRVLLYLHERKTLCAENNVNNRA